MPSVECRGCGEYFEVYPYREDTAQYCSRACQRSRVEKVCEICRETFIVHEYRADTARFCSYECKGEHHSEEFTGPDHPNWTGGTDHYKGKDWSKQREKTLNRDEYRCQFCGMDNNESIALFNQSLHVHHVIPYRISEDNTTSNLITLCSSCHHRIRGKTHREQ